MKHYREASILMDAPEISQALSRIAKEILEHGDVKELALVGIRTRGVQGRSRLAANPSVSFSPLRSRRRHRRPAPSLGYSIQVCHA